MNIDNTRGPSHPNIISGLSDVQEAGAGISAQSAQQLLYGAMMEDEIANCINQLTAGLSIKPQFPAGLPPISNCPPEEGLLEASSMPMTSLSMQAARRLPATWTRRRATRHGRRPDGLGTTTGWPWGGDYRQRASTAPCVANSPKSGAAGLLRPNAAADNAVLHRATRTGHRPSPSSTVDGPTRP